MARKKISEYSAKQILFQELGLPYSGISCTTSDYKKAIEKLATDQTYVVKVDQGVKKRMKQGLVGLKKSPQEIPAVIQDFQKKGYTNFIIEPFLPHDQLSEKYLSFSRVREGVQVLYSAKGGIDIEENQGSIQQLVISSSSDEEKIKDLAKALLLTSEIINKLLKAFDIYYFSFLEINPLVVENGKFYFLDVAAEVDSAGEFFVQKGWTEQDFRSGMVKELTEAEVVVNELAQKSQASFTLNVLNKEGSVFMLLSGGGASIVLADEVYNLGLGKELANYGEYSGNPNADEVYVYTRQVLNLLLNSKAKKKVLVVGGGVANFTDIRKTFTGVIKALSEVSKELQKQQVKVYVRRGGPHQEAGLAHMRDFLEKEQLLGFVSGPDLPLPEVVQLAIKELEK